MQKSGTSKGYGEREITLASLKRKGALFQGSLCSPLKCGGFWLQKEWHRLGVFSKGLVGPNRSNNWPYDQKILKEQEIRKATCDKSAFHLVRVT